MAARSSPINTPAGAAGGIPAPGGWGLQGLEGRGQIYEVSQLFSIEINLKFP